MPSRWICAVIVLFWLVCTGWLFVQDLLPRLLPGRPPPYTIDPTEEATHIRAPTDFAVRHHGQKAFLAKTRVSRTGRDEYELTAQLTPSPGGKPVVAHFTLVRRMNSLYRVSGEGNLLGVAVRLSGSLVAGALADLPGADVGLELAGDVEGGTLPLRATVDLPGNARRSAAEAVPVGRGAAFLLPLHPVNRLRGLRAGQSWSTYALEPIPNPFGSPGSGVRFLRAAVRADEEPAGLGRLPGEPCLVIDYTGDGLSVATWVSQKTGKVLAQEVKLGRDHWLLSRESP